MEKKKSIAFIPKKSESAPKMNEKKVNQYIATIIVNIYSFSHGVMMGWPSPIAPLLQSDTPPNGIPKLSNEDISWIGSMLALSGIITIPIFSYTLDTLGRKVTGYIMAALCILNWLLILFANSALMIHAGRFLAGMAGGGTAILCSTYVIDIAEDDIKGTLGSFLGTLVNGGCLFMFIIGSYLSYTWTASLGLMVPVVFLLLFFWLPESPIYLLTKSRETEARKAMKWFRNGNLKESEMQRLVTRASEVIARKKSKISLRFLMERATFRALLLGIFLMLNNQLCGSFAIINYTVLIFKESGSDLSPNLSAILVGALLTIGGYIATLLVERAGRRLLLISTNIFMTGSLVVLGYYFYMKSVGSDVTCLGWLPVTCLSVYIVTFACGCGTLPFPILVEITSSQARPMVTGICIFVLSFSAFIISKTFLGMVHILGMHGCYWMFAAFCFLCTVIVYVALPETKGRSPEDVMEQLDSDGYIHSVIKGYRLSEDEKQNATPV